MRLRKAAPAELPGTVHTYESLGEEGQLAAKIGTTTVLVVTPPDLRLKTRRPGDAAARANHVHLFDAGRHERAL